MEEERANQTTNLRKRRYGDIAYTRHGEGKDTENNHFVA
jgi:hypothetical protein